jgi:hypothetical protein
MKRTVLQLVAGWEAGGKERLTPSSFVGARTTDANIPSTLPSGAGPTRKAWIRVPSRNGRTGTMQSY